MTVSATRAIGAGASARPAACRVGDGHGRRAGGGQPRRPRGKPLPANDPLATLPPHLRRQQKRRRQGLGGASSGIASLGRALGSGAAAAAGAVGAVSFGPTPPQFLETVGGGGGGGAGVGREASAALARVGLLRADGPTLALGDDGAAVKALQAFLVDQGCLAPDLPVGYFGAKTQEALVAWQSAQGISPATGLCGGQTRSALKRVATLGASSSPATEAPAPSAPMPTATATATALPGAAASGSLGWLDLPDYGDEYATEDEDGLALEGEATLISHECVQGESLASIAREYMVDVQRIVQMNPHIRDVRGVPEGTVLRIPDEQDSHSFYGFNSLFAQAPVADDKPVVAAGEAVHGVAAAAAAATRSAAPAEASDAAKDAPSAIISHGLQSLVLGRPPAPAPGPASVEANPLLVLPVMAVSFALAVLAGRTRARRMAAGPSGRFPAAKKAPVQGGGGGGKAGRAGAGPRRNPAREEEWESPSQARQTRDRLRSSVEVEIPGAGRSGGQGTVLPPPPPAQPRAPAPRSAPGRTPVRMTVAGSGVSMQGARVDALGSGAPQPRSSGSVSSPSFPRSQAPDPSRGEQ